MKVELESKYEVEDEIKVKRDNIWHSGIIIDIEFLSNVIHSKFYYLIEFPDKTRNWIPEDYVEPKTPREY